MEVVLTVGPIVTGFIAGAEKVRNQFANVKILKSDLRSFAKSIHLMLSFLDEAKQHEHGTSAAYEMLRNDLNDCRNIVIKIIGKKPLGKFLHVGDYRERLKSSGDRISRSLHALQTEIQHKALIEIKKQGEEMQRWFRELAELQKTGNQAAAAAAVAATSTLDTVRQRVARTAAGAAADEGGHGDGGRERGKSGDTAAMAVPCRRQEVRKAVAAPAAAAAAAATAGVVRAARKLQRPQTLVSRRDVDAPRPEARTARAVAPAAAISSGTTPRTPPSASSASRGASWRAPVLQRVGSSRQVSIIRGKHSISGGGGSSSAVVRCSGVGAQRAQGRLPDDTSFLALYKRKTPPQVSSPTADAAPAKLAAVASAGAGSGPQRIRKPAMQDRPARQLRKDLEKLTIVESGLVAGAESSKALQQSVTAEREMVPPAPATPQTWEGQVSASPLVATCSAQGVVCLWDSVSPGEPNCRRLTPSSQSGNLSGSIRSRNANRVDAGDSVGDSVATCIAWRPDGNRLAAASHHKDGAVRVWDVSLLSSRQSPSQPSPRPEIRSPLQWRAHDGAVTCLSWNPYDMTQLASGGGDKVLHVWKLNKGSTRTGPMCMTKMRHDAGISAVAWRPGTDSLNRCLASADKSGVIRLWSSGDGASASTRSMPCLKPWFDGATSAPALLCLSWSSGGSHLASGGSDGIIRIWDAAAGAFIRPIRTGNTAVTCLAWGPQGAGAASPVSGPQGSTLLASCGHIPGVQLWDTRALCGRGGGDGGGSCGGGNDHCALALQAADPHPVNIRSLSWSSDGLQMAGVGQGVMYVWDVRTCDVVTCIKFSDEVLSCVQWRPGSPYF